MRIGEKARETEDNEVKTKEIKWEGGGLTKRRSWRKTLVMMGEKDRGNKAGGGGGGRGIERGSSSRENMKSEGKSKKSKKKSRKLDEKER